MARPKKYVDENINTEVVQGEPEVEELESIEVELVDLYKNYSGIHIKHILVSFKNNKAKVSKETAEQLRESGYVK